MFEMFGASTEPLRLEKVLDARVASDVSGGYVVPRHFVQLMLGWVKHWDNVHRRKMKRQRRERGRRRQ